ncbi:Mu transposase C-terminal domain-containing protein [Devosia ginsengisoli]|uniref:Transposase family protein n=1 Tax=Devosia ginsengisoli TaxID=400770 RepID=A0A5B8LS60_9HYPH|nr:Mu transposase C-terminal domain-containing protein [Devosia ginsengisoli]QDZ10729.1 transposase family protein [Devosia ginsengisoli]
MRIREDNSGLIKHDIVEFPDGRYRFDHGVGDLLVFTKQGSGEVFDISKERYDYLFEAGDVRQIITPIAASGRIQFTDVPETLPPDTSIAAALRAQTMQWFTRQYDDDPLAVSLGKSFIEKFVRSRAKEASRLGLTHQFSAPTLIRDIQNRGRPGHRPIGYFLDRRGQYAREPQHPEIADLRAETVTLYWTRALVTKSDAFAFYRTELAGINEERVANGLGEIPPPKEMTSVIEAIDAAECHETWTTKWGRQAADEHYKGTAEHIVADEIGDVIIIDHTTLDTYLLMDTEYGVVFGRPTVTIAIDVKSRSIVGFLISPEPPSLYTVVTILKRVVSHKKRYHKLYPELGSDWDPFCRPTLVLVDNGAEFISPSFQQALLDVGIIIKRSPVATPQFKAIGERFFHTLNLQLSHKAPGTTVQGKRKSRKPAKPGDGAVITYSEADELLYRCILNYEKSEHDGLRGRKPRDVWSEGVSRGCRKTIRDVRLLETLIGNIDTVPIARDGITFKNFQFHDEVATSFVLNFWARNTPKRDRRKKGAMAKVTIKYNPADCTRIYVYCPTELSSNPWVALPNTMPDYAPAMTFWHHDQVVALARKKKRNVKDENALYKSRDDLRRITEAKLALSNTRDGAKMRRLLQQDKDRLAGGRVEEVEIDNDAPSVEVGAFNSVRMDAQFVPPGAAGGRAKAAATRKRNDKARARLAQLEAPDEPGDAAGPDSTAGLVRKDFLKMAGWSK